MAEQPCDFCGAPVTWTPEQETLDLHLRLMGSGLGAMCDACDERQIAIYQREEAEMRAEDEQDAIDEEAELWEEYTHA